MISKSNGIIMRKNSKSSGSVMVLGLFLLLILSGLLAAVSPMIINELKFSTINRDAIEAQFAAEAGAKVALEALYKASTSWSWVGKETTFVAGDTTKNYKVTLAPGVTEGVEPAAHTVFTITSVGTVRNMKRTVTVRAKTALNSMLNYAVFSEKDITINTGTITGSIASNTTLTINKNAGIINGNALAWTLNDSSNHIKFPYTTTCKYPTATCDQTITEQPNSRLNVAALSQSLPPFSPTGGNLPTASENLPGGSYYINANYSMNNDYTISSGQSVTIYVNGRFDMTGRIKGTGKNITIYATGDILVNNGAVIQTEEVGGTVNIYSRTNLTMNGKSGNRSEVNGSTVTMIIGESFSFNGGTINANLANSVTKVYVNGNVTAANNAIIGSTMTAMIVSSNGTINVGSSALNNTLLIAKGAISASNGCTVAGLYSENSISVGGATVTYSPNTKNSLDLPFAIRSWGL